MSFPTDRIELGPHAYGRRPRTYGVVIHTTEYPSSSLADGLRCIRDQSPGGSLYAGGGSYHFVLTDEGPILAVPYLDAAGGLSGDHTPPTQISPRTGRPGTWSPERFPWLRQALPAEAYADPNLYMLQLSVSGRTALLSTYPSLPRIVDDAARIIAWAEGLPEVEDNLVVSGHLNWQTDRSDPGQAFIDRVMARYAELTAEPAPPPEPSQPTREERLAREVIGLRAAKPTGASRWARWTGLIQAADGLPLRREARLAGEAMYLRLFTEGS